jgi:N-acetylmuramoyl-L-alanine amidase
MFRLISLLGLLGLCLCVALHAQPPYRSASSSKSVSTRSWNRQNARRKPALKPPLLMQKTLIILDPGHGGHDVGTQSISTPRYQEKSLNLITAQFVKRFLQQLGYQVFMTREEDVFVSLDKRAQLANERMPTLFVSIHYNSAPSAEAKGVEVFFYPSKDNKERLLKSKRLAQAVLRHVIEQTGAKSRGVKQANYAVIRETHMPAILIEGGFVTNEAELQKLKDPVYLKSLAWGIVCGIEEYLSKG